MPVLGRRHFWTISVITALVSFSMFPFSAQANPFLFGVADPSGPARLLLIDHNTGKATRMGNLDFDVVSFGLTDFQNRIFTFDQESDTVREINTFDATTVNSPVPITITGTTGSIQTIGEGSLALNPVNGNGFLTRSRGGLGDLWNFNLTLPTATGNQIRDIDSNPLTPSIDGLDFHSNGVLYGLSQSGNCGGTPECDPTPHLYTINQQNGNTTMVGDTGVTGSILGGLAFAPNGNLFAAINDRLYTLDIGNGMATPVGDGAPIGGPFGISRISGLTFIDVPDFPSGGLAEIPEPSSILLFASGLFGIAAWRYRNTTTN